MAISITAPSDKNALLSVGTDLLAVYDIAQPAATYLWSKVSGPGDVVFSSATSLATHVDFTKNGIYILKITATYLTFTSTSMTIITVLDLEVLPISDLVL